ncbi:MAG: ABC transporter substrate binding protein [Nitrosomonadales bacterium]
MFLNAKFASCLLLLACLFAPEGHAEPVFRVLVVQSDNTLPYQTFTKALHFPAHFQIEILPRAEEFSAQPADLVVTLGVRATELLSGKTTLPVLAAMIPSATALPAKQLRSRTLTAAFLDQPPARQAAFVRAVLPERTRVGVLYFTDNRFDLAGFRAELSRQGGVLVKQNLRSDATLFEDLEAVLGESDVLLAVPDNAVYNGNTIRNILLSSYRRSIPLVGFSPSYVKAGALCALYSTPEQLAAQASAMIISFSVMGKLPEPQYPLFYSIALNQEVARTLGLTLTSVEMIRLQVEKMSGSTR